VQTSVEHWYNLKSKSDQRSSINSFFTLCTYSFVCQDTPRLGNSEGGSLTQRSFSLRVKLPTVTSNHLKGRGNPIKCLAQMLNNTSKLAGLSSHYLFFMLKREAVNTIFYSLLV